MSHPAEPDLALFHARLATENLAPLWEVMRDLAPREPRPVVTPAIRTMGAFMQLLPKSFMGAPIRSTDGTVYSVVEGSGTVCVGEESWDVGPLDVFVVPSWIRHEFSANENLILFSFSDRPLQQALGFWREERHSMNTGR